MKLEPKTELAKKYDDYMSNRIHPQSSTIGASGDYPQEEEEIIEVPKPTPKPKEKKNKSRS
jgi:hypothetical protein